MTHPLYTAYLSRFPGRKALAEALNYDGGKELSTGTSKLCREVKLCGLIDVAIHLGINGRLYVRAIDFTFAGPSCSVDPEVQEAAINRLLRGQIPGKTGARGKIRADINNFVNSIDKPDRQSGISQKLQDTYREEIGDPEAMATEMMNRTNFGTSRRTNQKFISIELIPHFLSRISSLETPPDPSWEPVWKLIQAMEPLGSCPLSDPKIKVSRRQEIVDSLEGVAEFNPPRRKKREPLPDVVIPPEEDGEVEDGDEVNIPNDRLLQQTRAKMVVMIRSLRKSLAASRAKFHKAFIEDSAAEELRAAKSANADLRLRAKQWQQEMAHYKARALMAEREINDNFRIEQAVDLSKMSLSKPAAKMMTSYAALYKGLSAEFIIAYSVRRECSFNQAILAMERAKSALDQAVKSGNGKILISAETQTEIQWDILVMQEKVKIHKEVEEAHGNRLVAIAQDKSRTENVPALKGKEAEDRLQAILVQMSPENATVLVTRNVDHCGDFMLVFREDDVITGYSIIDCKSYSGPVPTKQVDKFESDIDHCTQLFGSPPRWSAIISIESDIIHEGVSGAPDFDHGTTPVFLIHSAHRSGDISTTVRDMLSKAKYVQKVRPFIPIELSACVEISSFEKKITEKKSGRGRSHSQTKARVVFDERSQSRHRSSSGAREIITEDGEVIQRGKTMRSSQTVAIGLDPRIFTTSELSQANINIANAMSKIYRYEQGKIERSKNVVATMARIMVLGESAINHALKEILVSENRIGHRIHNLSLI